MKLGNFSSPTKTCFREITETRGVYDVANWNPSNQAVRL